MRFIEMRGENPLRAVVEGTEANAHLVAGNAFGWGVEHAMEQYNLPREKVFAAIKFYVDNQEAIERLYDESSVNAPTHEEQLARLKARAEAWRKEQSAQHEEQ